MELDQFDRRQKFVSKKTLLIAAAIVVVIGLGWFAWAKAGKREITVANTNGIFKKFAAPTPTPTGPLTGTECGQKPARPMAVMLASDPETRPLAGLAAADMVVEIPVTESGVTRMMAVYQCSMPSEFGSIRSARMDFIPLVKGFDALFMHWGGEREALATLNAGATDNVDCLKYDGTACRRTSNLPMPHNGYSMPKSFLEKARVLGYDTARASTSYVFDEKAQSQGTLSPPTLYAGDFAVTWSYNPATNRYFRARGARAEVDRLTNTQVGASNIIILKTTSQYVSILYNRVKTTGSGTATVYHNGVAIPATWQKEGERGKLKLLDTSDKEIPLVPGSTWFEFVTQ